MNTTANFIKTIRKQENLSQLEFSKLIAVNQQAVSNWENGRDLPSLRNAYNISVNLPSVSIYDIIDCMIDDIIAEDKI